LSLSVLVLGSSMVFAGASVQSSTKLWTIAWSEFLTAEIAEFLFQIFGFLCVPPCPLRLHSFSVTRPIIPIFITDWILENNIAHPFNNGKRFQSI
jgi:hypothetical protein